MVCVLAMDVGAQTLNVPAGWPNANWTVTGSYATTAIAFESDPTTTANFAFDDDDAGSGHEDNIAAESPVIDLTPAFSAGEMSIEVSAEYGFRKNAAVEVLRLEYWNAATSAWVIWSDIVGNNTAILDDFCTIPKTTFRSSSLNISTFTPAQLTGFKYRIFYDDNPAGTGYQYGFCFSSPTLSSLACGAPTGLAVTAASVTTSGADITWTAIPGVTGFEYVLNTTSTDPVGAGTATTATSYSATGLPSSTVHYFHLRTICTAGNSAWRTVSFTTRALPPVNDEIAGAILLTLDEGTACGANAITGISNEASSGSVFVAPTCSTQYTPTTTNGDIWYRFVAPAANVTLNTSAVVGISTVAAVLYSEAAGVYTEVGACGNGWPKNYTGLVPGNTYYLRAWDYGNDNIGTFTLCGYYLNCTVPVATYTVVSDCASGIDQFFVDVDVTNMGSATTLNVSDNQGNTDTATAIGVLRMGPYVNSTSVIITVANSTNAACTITSTARTQTVCPPVNDICSGAIDLATLTSPFSGTTVGALNDYLTYCTNSGTSGSSTAPDIYYSILVPSGSTLKINQTTNNYDSTNIVFYGDCTTRTQIACFDDPDETVVNWANNTGSDQTVYWIQDGISGSGTFTLAWELIDCVNPVATYTVVSDCANGNEEFFVDTDITSLGSASSLAVYDDQGGSVQVVTQAGVYRFGPFANGTPVSITVENEQSATCTLTSPVRTQTVCPPVNDNCTEAIALTVNSSLTCTVVTAGSTNGATASSQTDDVSGTPNNDVWYSFVATATSHRISLTNIVATAGTSVDMGIGIYNGTAGCGSLVLVGSSDPETYDVTGLTAGVTYFVRVYGWGSLATNFNNFDICVGTPPPPPPAPANDNCEAAIALTVNANYGCSVVTAGTTSGATASPQADDVSGTPNNDVWFSFVATGTAHRVSLTNIVATAGTSVDMGIGVYNGTAGCSSLVLVGSSDPETYNVTGLTAGVTYYVRVYGWGTAATNYNTFNICIGSPPPAPANDLIANAAVLNESPVLTCTNAIAGTTESATHSAEYACSTTDVDVWYTFTPSTTGIYNFSRTVSSGTGNGYISVYSGTSASLTRLNTSCSSTSFSQALTAGTQYYVSVSSTATSTLSFVLCVSPAPPAPANDLIANASVLTESTDLNCSNSVAGTTVSATHSAEYACSATDVDVWYTFTPATTGSYLFRRTVSSGTGNGYISVYSGAPGSLTRLNTSCFVNNFTQALTAGTQYYVSVSSTATSTLSFALCVYPLPAVPANDTCATAIATTLPYTQTLDATSATNTGGFVSACGLGMNDGVWYTVVGDGGNITVAITNVIGWDPELGIYTGTCGTFTCVAGVDSGAASVGETYTISNSVVGTTYYINVGNFSGSTDNAEGPFTINITTTLSNPTFDNAAFKAYPNPVKDMLKLSYSQDMTSVSVFNLLGQQVINKELNASEAQVDMSNLSAGTYLVKVAVDNQVKTIKVVKQ